MIPPASSTGPSARRAGCVESRQRIASRTAVARAAIVMSPSASPYSVSPSSGAETTRRTWSGQSGQSGATNKSAINRTGRAAT